MQTTNRTADNLAGISGSQHTAETARYATAALDGLSAHVAIVDADGVILAVNRAWRRFASANAAVGSPADGALPGLGVGANYVEVCRAAALAGCDEAQQWLVGRQAVLAGETDLVEIEYPCHGPGEQRWFVARITSCAGEGPACLVIAHETSTARKLSELAHSESEARHRSLFEDNQSIILLIDADSGELVDVNPAAAAYYGWTREQMRKMHVSAIDTMSAAEIGAEFDRAAAEGRNYVSLQHRRADGTLRAMEVYVSSVVLGGRNLRYAIVHDVTERTHAEMALISSEAALKRSQEVAHIGHWTWDTRSNTVAWSDEMKRIFGLDALTFAGDLDAVIDHAIHPDDAARVRGMNAAVLQEQAPEPAEYRVVWPDGSVHHIRAIPSDRITDEGGHIVHLAGVVQDITERKVREVEREQLLRQVQNQAEQLAQVVNSALDSVMLLDSSGRIVLRNAKAEALLEEQGVCGEEDRLLQLAGVSLAALLAPPPSGQWHTVTVEQKTYEAVAKSLETGPLGTGFILVVRDVTVDRQVREQLARQERLAAVGQLAAGIAHDFNNIMSVISVYAELLSESPRLTEKEHARAHTIIDQTRRATHMIRQILDFSRQSVFERQLLDLLPLLKEQVKLLKQTLPESIEVTLVHAQDEYMVLADPTRIQQLVMNLAVNARDAMPQGGMLTVELARMSASEGSQAPLAGPGPGSWVQLIVHDTGSGITPSHLYHIFEPFFTTKAPGKGTGLGLAQVHGIVAQHDGHIGVASEVGAGTIFTISLPAVVAQDTAAAGEAKQLAPPLGHGERVLVVEDEPAVRTALAELLEQWHYRVEQASNGDEALARVAQSAPQVDLIVSDVVMPKMGGIDLVRALRKNGLSTPVILLSGYVAPGDREQIKGLGIEAWLDKPPDADLLAKAVARALGGPNKANSSEG